MFPWLILFVTVPNPLAVYRESDMHNTMMLVGFHLGFGLAQICSASASPPWAWR